MTISILGSTGSIGTQTLEVAQQLNIKIAALTAHSNIDLLESQIRNFKPSLVVVYDEGKALELKNRIGGIVEISTGIEGLKQAASMGEASVIVNALVGNIGLTPTVAAIKAGKIIALANKEVLVAAGSIIMPLSRQYNAPIVPVDSEHSAILQCLKGEAAPSKIYLTASGGPFRGKTKAEMKNITVDEALKHPNWSMGKKIYIDSATMMNKGLEVIEAYHLFDLKPSQIEVLVHPQSIIHSMVEFEDGVVMAQLGTADMRTAIQYAITHPNRTKNNFERLDFAKYNTLTFEKPDMEAFNCLALSYQALEAEWHYPAVLNAANEVAVDAFLNKKIKFLDISLLIEKALSAYNDTSCPLTIESVLEAEKWAKAYVEKEIG